MNKKLIISFSVIGVVAAVAIGGTVAYFSAVQTSSGNIITAGTMDLKVDHTLQTYNDVNCKTCSVEIVSDTSDMVIARNGVSIGPTNAVLVSNPHTRWTADVGNPNAKWIWATDPTLTEDTYNTSYTFTKAFDWFGPFEGSTLNFSVGSDNSVVVYLNGVEIGRNDSEFGYQTPISISFTPAQGTNELKFVVTNWDQSHNPPDNPAGLKYALTINGNCGDDYFKTHCQLWASTDLTNQHFWDFADVKPGDHGTNVISLHVQSNDAYICMFANGEQNNENGVIDAEIKAGESPDNTVGDLSQYLNLVVWQDTDGDGVHQPGEAILYNGGFDGLDSGITKLSLPGNGNDNLGIAWCLGTQTMNEDGSISCDGSGNQDKAQTDSMVANLVLYAIQQRNNANFTCAGLQIDKSSPQLFQ